MIDNLLSELPIKKDDIQFISLRDLLNLGSLLDASLDEDENNPSISLKKILNHGNVSVATLATAIENNGIYTWDRYGRFKLFQKDTAEAQQALLLLQNIFEYEIDPSPGKSDKQHPLDASNDWDDPYWRFGWAMKELPNLKNIKYNQLEMLRKETPIGKREKSSYLRIIGALVEYISGKTPGVDKHPSFENETKLIADLDKFYDGYEGLSASNLSRKFPQANRVLKE